MPKRKRLPSIPLMNPRPSKKRKKSTASNDSNSNNNKSTDCTPRTKKQMIPKSALEYLDDPLDHVLFFDLLSKTKRPRNALEWDLMSQAFIHNGSQTVTGDTLHEFYSILVDSGCIDDPHFEEDSDEDDDITSCTTPTIHYCIDFTSNEYQNAHTKFMHKLHAFINEEEEEENEDDDDEESRTDRVINAAIWGKNVDLFYLYIVVTKHGGLDTVNSNKAWMSILHEMSAHYNPHHRSHIINELQSIYNKYLSDYEQMYFESDCIHSGDDFGDDLYLETDSQIMNILTQYPLKCAADRMDDDDDRYPPCYWLEMVPNGNHLQSMFGDPICAKQDMPYNADHTFKQRLCVSGSDKADLLQRLFVDMNEDRQLSSSDSEIEILDDMKGKSDDDDDGAIGSILKSMICHEETMTELTEDEITNHRDWINKDLCVCGVKGMHPYTRKLIDWILSECDSDISLAEINSNKRTRNKRKSSAANNNLFALTAYEIDYIVDILILKVLRLLCALNNRETSMISAFEVGLNLLRKQYADDADGYSLYCGHYSVYYKRIMCSFESFYERAMKMAHNFLSHPKGLGIVCINSRCRIAADTFLAEMGGDLYSVPRWIEHSFCIENLYHKLLSGARLNYLEYPVVMEYIGCTGYNVLSVMNLNNNHWTSLLNHSCAPNCVIKPFVNCGRIGLGLFALQEIVLGDELSINYGLLSCDAAVCCESICLCGLRGCRGTYIAYRDVEIEDLYLSSHHDYISRRLVQLLLSTVSPLTAAEEEALNALHLLGEEKEKRMFGDWMYKYFAFLASFISAEHEELAQMLVAQIDRRNEYTLMDAQRDANHLLLRRVRSASICVSRIECYLKQQESLLGEIAVDWAAKHDQIPKYLKLFASSHNLLCLPPIRFAEIDEIIGRLWNDEDSLMNRLLNCLSRSISSQLYDIIRTIVCRAGLMEESQYGLYLIRCKFIQIAKILANMKCTKINRHWAAADVLYLYANTYRFAKTQSYLSFASCYEDVAVISSYRDVKKSDNRYLTRSVRQPAAAAAAAANKEASSTKSERFIYSSAFALICLLGWQHHDVLGVKAADEISKAQYDEYFEHVFGTALLPDIESCYDAQCKGLYMNTHRNYLFKCLREKKCWMNTNYTKQYEHQHDSNTINSCPVPQFTFQNKIGLFGSPVFDSYFDGFAAARHDNDNAQYIKDIVQGMQNDYNFKPRK
eukprot:154774_1